MRGLFCSPWTTEVFNRGLWLIWCLSWCTGLADASSLVLCLGRGLSRVLVADNALSQSCWLISPLPHPLAFIGNWSRFPLLRLMRVSFRLGHELPFSRRRLRSSRSNGCRSRGRSVAEVNRPPLPGTPGGAVPEGAGRRRVFCRDPALLTLMEPRAQEGAAACPGCSRRQPGAHGGAAGLRKAAETVGGAPRAEAGGWKRWRRPRGSRSVAGWPLERLRPRASRHRAASQAAAPPRAVCLAPRWGAAAGRDERPGFWGGRRLRQPPAAQRLPEGAVPVGEPEGNRLRAAVGASCRPRFPRPDRAGAFARWGTPASCLSCYFCFLEGYSRPAVFLSSWPTTMKCY